MTTSLNNPRFLKYLEEIKLPEWDFENTSPDEQRSIFFEYSFWIQNKRDECLRFYSCQTGDLRNLYDYKRQTKDNRCIEEIFDNFLGIKK